MVDSNVLEPQAFQPLFRLVNWLCQPAVCYPAALALFFAALALRRHLAKPRVAIGVLGASLMFIGISLGNRHFLAEASKPDHITLWALALLAAFCLWTAIHQAVRNDERLRQGLKLEEGDAAQSSFQVWPYLLYLEAIVAAFAMAALLIWALALDAPLELAADPANSPNPMKAPWYFVGLQELLVYFDPWIAGVMLPILTVTGLACLPYCDRDPEGVGGFSFERRRFAITVYLLGFLMVWVMPIMVGMFLRGPNWSAYGLYETWDAHKFGAAGSTSLSQMVWQGVLHRPTTEPLHWLLRELPGLLLLAAYFIGVPLVAAKTWRTAREQLGRARYWIVALHLLAVVGVPAKMLLHWVCGLSYVVYLPEHALNV